MKSSAGQRYSFGVSKFDRFKTPTKPQNTEYKFDADKHSTFTHHFFTTKRSAGIGFGTKTDFSKGPQTRAKQNPGQQNIPTRFDMNRRSGYGYNFGNQPGRAGYKQVLLNNMSADKVVPGPGAYSPTHRLRELNLHQTCRPFTQQLPNQTVRGNFPGPGEQSMEKASIDAKGNQTLSKFKGSGATKIDPPRKMNKVRSASAIPGPGTQDNQESVNKSGTQAPSKYENSFVRTFGKGNRSQLARINGTPGPGNQETDSTFVGPDLAGQEGSRGDLTLNTTLQTNDSAPRKTSKKRSASTERF